MDDYESITKDEVIQALELDIKQYRRKHDYHQSISEEYLERIDAVEKKLVRVKEKMNEKNTKAVSK